MIGDPLAESILAAGLWGSIGGVAYAYAGYPVVVWGLSGVFGRDEGPAVRTTGASAGDTPRVTLVIAAHNEAEVIDARIRNALASDYPPERLEIVVASDGSDDGTVEIARGHEPRVRTLAYAQRRGKSATLNATIAQLDTDVIVLSDANTFFDPDAIGALVRRLADPAVGVVCGRLILRDATTGRNVDGLYWRYETFLKRCEAALGGLLGANGAIYAIRRSLVVPLPAGTVVDDFVLPLMSKIRSGCRIAYEPAAVAHEETAPDLTGEFRRRARIGVGGFQALWILRALLSPTQGWTAFTFWSHKVLRWICPFLLVIALVCAAALATTSTAYAIAFAAQLGLYAAAALVGSLPSGWGFARPLRILPMFVCMNAALLVGFLRWVRGSHSGVWRRTARLRDAGSA